jgi:hypothetical protein
MATSPRIKEPSLSFYLGPTHTRGLIFISPLLLSPPSPFTQQAYIYHLLSSLTAAGEDWRSVEPLCLRIGPQPQPRRRDEWLSVTGPSTGTAAGSRCGKVPPRPPPVQVASPAASDDEMWVWVACPSAGSRRWWERRRRGALFSKILFHVIIFVGWCVII